MRYGICILSMIPVRDKPSNKSEMINQLLFGDLVRIKSKNRQWLLTESLSDNYAGWVDEKQIQPLEKAEFLHIHDQPLYFLAQPVATAEKNTKPVHITLGSSLRFWDGQQIKINGSSFRFNKPLETYTGKMNTRELADIARKFMGTPYLWGGRSIFGIDCSGFTQLVFKIAGYQLERDTSAQSLQGETVNFIHEAQTGDLAFFENEEEEIIHVGILLNKDIIIHASGEVRTDPIDHEGIFNTEKHQYSHKLRIIKRIITS